MSDEPERLWMLDLDERDLPWQAHLIVEDDGEVRVTACGQRVTSWLHPRGWWRWRAGELPLSGPNDIHCGREESAAASR